MFYWLWKISITASTFSICMYIPWPDMLARFVEFKTLPETELVQGFDMLINSSNNFLQSSSLKISIVCT